MDSSTEASMAEFLDRVLQMGDVEQGHRGSSPPKCSSYDLRLYHRIMCRQMEMQKSTNLCSVMTNYSGKVHSSTRPISKLQKVSIADLRLEELAKGKYLILRTIELPVKIVGIMSIVEDDAGTVTNFSLYNFCSHLDASAEEVLPIGTVFILKEPYYRVPVGSVPCILRCDCPSDIVILKESHPLFYLAKDVKWKNELAAPCSNPMSAHPRPKGPEEWKSRGNGLFKAGKISCAQDCYLLALRKAEKRKGCGEVRKVLHLNLAACHLQLQRFEAALASASTVLVSEPHNLKALFRAGKAAYGLRKYKEAAGFYKRLCETHPENKEGKEERIRAEDRVSEEESGNVCVYKLCLERALRPKQKIDCGDFAGPVRVAKITGKGRGVIATRDLEPGTLLVVSKAFQIAWMKCNQVYLQVNSNRTVDHGGNMELVSAVAEAVMKNPLTFGPLVYDLSLGGQEAGRRGPLKVFCDADKKDEPIADVERIKRILNTNCFTCQTGGSFTHSAEMQWDWGSGLFFLPSYFNHSCLPNAHWEIYNDVMVVHSTKFIRSGEEISISYFNLDANRETREVVWRQRGFTCHCPHCAVFRQEPARLRMERDRLMAHFDAALRPHFNRQPCIISRKLVRGLEKLIDSVEATYAPSADGNCCKTELLTLYCFLVIGYTSQKRHNDVVRICFKVISLFGFDPAEIVRFGDATQNWSSLSGGFLSVELLSAIEALIEALFMSVRLDEGQSWIKVIVALERVLIGGDVRVVKLNHPNIKDVIA